MKTTIKTLKVRVRDKHAKALSKMAFECNQDWKNLALHMATTSDMSWRQIAAILGVPKSTVSDYLRRELKGYIKPLDKPTIGSGGDPRVLIIDIETAPILASVYSLWNNDSISIKQIENDWFILSLAAKWWGEEEIFYLDQRDAKNIEDDTPILKMWVDLVNQADVVVGYNSRNYDTKRINTRLIINGMSKPHPFKQIDLYRIVKEQFNFTSGSLAYVSSKLVPNNKKSEHNKFPGMLLWQECLRGNLEAWEENEAYNIQDIRVTEALLEILLPWSSKAVNLALFDDSVENVDIWEHVSYTYTNTGKYKVYRNKITGKYMRSRLNEFSKEKRESLMVNISGS